VIDVPACLGGAESCQANRRVFVLNNVSEPALSPDGTRLAFRGWGEPPTEDNPYFGCAKPVPVRYLANTTLDGTELRGAGGFWEDSHPDWSPDGKRLLFDTGRNGDDIIRILVINVDGSGEEDLRIAGQQPSWASDNERFVYRGCDVTGNRCGLWLAKAIPAKPWETGFNMLGPVLEEPAAAHPDWSPLGDQIVYQSPASGSWDLHLINADGSGKRQLTNDPAIEGLPAWSPDGQWIAYVSDVGGNWGIWVIRADGSERRQLFAYDGGIYKIPKVVEPYGQRDWLDEQISWSK
jgi:TolB protein